MYAITNIDPYELLRREGQVSICIDSGYETGSDHCMQIDLAESANGLQRKAFPRIIGNILANPVENDHFECRARKGEACCERSKISEVQILSMPRLCRQSTFTMGFCISSRRLGRLGATHTTSSPTGPRSYAGPCVYSSPSIQSTDSQSERFAPNTLSTAAASWLAGTLNYYLPSSPHWRCHI